LIILPLTLFSGLVILFIVFLLTLFSGFKHKQIVGGAVDHIAADAVLGLFYKLEWHPCLLLLD